MEHHENGARCRVLVQMRELSFCCLDPEAQPLRLGCCSTQQQVPLERQPLRQSAGLAAMAAAALLHTVGDSQAHQLLHQPADGASAASVSRSLWLSRTWGAGRRRARQTPPASCIPAVDVIPSLLQGLRVQTASKMAECTQQVLTD